MCNPLLGHPVLEGVDSLFFSDKIKVTGVRLPATSVEVSSGFRVGGAATQLFSVTKNCNENCNGN